MNKTKEFTKHAIQLNDIKVIELSLKVNIENAQDFMPDEGFFGLYHGYSEYNPDDKKIVIKIGVDMNEDMDSDDGINETPFDLKVELVGVFDVDEDRFPIQHIEHWASTNAPLILYPYLREHVHSLTNKAGFDGLFLPLFEVPVFKLNT